VSIHEKAKEDIYHVGLVKAKNDVFEFEISIQRKGVSLIEFKKGGKKEIIDNFKTECKFDNTAFKRAREFVKEKYLYNKVDA
jgi:tRNA A37 threonylcarbamoyladenosine biosynthesis protein TsaE